MITNSHPLRVGRFFGLTVLLQGGLLLSGLLLLALLWELARFAVPQMDDFHYALSARDFGVWGSILHEAENWVNRPSATGLMSLFVSHFDLFEDYALIPRALLLGLLGGWIALTAALFVARLTLWQWLYLGLITALIFITTLPVPGQVIFWMSGGVTYGAGTALLLFYLAALVSAIRLARRQPVWALPLWLLALGLAVLTIGFHEALLASLVTLTSLLLLAAMIRWLVLRRPGAGWIALPLLILCLGTLASAGWIISAEGPWSRRADKSEISLVAAIALSILFALPLLPGYLLGFISWAAASLLTIPHWLERATGGLFGAERRLNARGGFALGASLLVIASTFAVAFYGTGDLGRPRHFTIALAWCLIFAPLWGWIAVRIFVPSLADWLLHPQRRRARLTALAAALMLGHILSDPLLSEAATSRFVGGYSPAAALHQQVTERALAAEAFAQNEAEAEILRLAPLREAPALLMGHDLDRSPDCLVNQHFARWFGIEAVAVMPEGLCRNAWRATTQK